MPTPWRPTKAHHLIYLALKEVGKPYHLGSEGPPELSLRTWDCSELTQHLLAWVGVSRIRDDADRITPVEQFDGAGFQWERCHHISVEDAVKTGAALLFVRSAADYAGKPHHVGHVAISLGNGYVVEARGKEYGVVISKVRASFNLAGKVRELYSPALLAPEEA